MNKDQLLSEFSIFSLGTGGFGDWITNETDDAVFKRLATIDSEPLSHGQLNQLLVLGHQAPLSFDFFSYYWLTAPSDHPYEVEALPGFEKSFFGSPLVKSIAHLKWGLYRIFVDALLWFGNVRAGYRFLRNMDTNQLHGFFLEKSFRTESIMKRGPYLKTKDISRDDRYLISEMACKSYGDERSSPNHIVNALKTAFRAQDVKGPIKIRRLLESESIKGKYEARQTEFQLSADDVMEESVTSEQDIEAKVERIAVKFSDAREAALFNTRLFLSMASDLDVYVATSMRTRQDFRKMADFCDAIFSDTRIKELNLRYFNPTLSSAEGHEDKGLIECLMVKCSKALIYCAGEKESYGKDAEAAMALSLGKPVIFYCDEAQKTRFYREVHPLSRLIEFQTGVAVGAIVTSSVDQVGLLLERLFKNKMQYRLESPKPGYLRLKECLTDSVVRLQTNDKLLTETFWNHYHAH
jgi:hypothetical protein